jgi:hypothetical protein
VCAHTHSGAQGSARDWPEYWRTAGKPTTTHHPPPHHVRTNTSKQTKPTNTQKRYLVGLLQFLDERDVRALRNAQLFVDHRQNTLRFLFIVMKNHHTITIKTQQNKERRKIRKGVSNNRTRRAQPSRAEPSRGEAAVDLFDEVQHRLVIDVRHRREFDAFCAVQTLFERERVLIEKLLCTHHTITSHHITTSHQQSTNECRGGRRRRRKRIRSFSLVKLIHSCSADQKQGRSGQQPAAGK